MKFIVFVIIFAAACVALSKSEDIIAGVGSNSDGGSGGKYNSIPEID